MFDSFVSPWTVAQQVPLSMEFSWQENWSGLPFPSPGDLPNTGIEPLSPALAGRFLTRRNLHNWANWEAPIIARRRSKNGPIISPPKTYFTPHLSNDASISIISLGVILGDFFLSFISYVSSVNYTPIISLLYITLSIITSVQTLINFLLKLQ